MSYSLRLGTHSGAPVNCKNNKNKNCNSTVNRDHLVVVSRMGNPWRYTHVGCVGVVNAAKFVAMGVANLDGYSALSASQKKLVTETFAERAGVSAASASSKSAASASSKATASTSSKAAPVTTCMVCDEEGDPAETIICDGCERETCFTCASPPLTKTPSGAWLCPTCLDTLPPSEFSVTGRGAFLRAKIVCSKSSCKYHLLPADLRLISYRVNPSGIFRHDYHVDCVTRDVAAEVVKRDFDAPGFDALTASQQAHVKSVFSDRSDVKSAAADSSSDDSDAPEPSTKPGRERVFDSSSDDSDAPEPSTKPGRERVFDSSSDDTDAPEPPPPARSPRKRAAPRAMTPAQQRRAADAARQRAPAPPPARVARGVSMSPPSEPSESSDSESSESDSPPSPPSSKRSRAAAPSRADTSSDS
ncbi:hypothetical protein TeGR_g3067, partial [Tetraparma gracilis]